MTLLNPAYLADALGTNSATTIRKDAQEEVGVLKRKAPQDDDINPKLKQFYEARTTIKPFYTGGKIVPLNEESFVCMCDSGIKVLSTGVKLKLEKSEDFDESENMGVGVVSVNDVSENKEFASSFSFLRELEIPEDEIIAFDACPSSNILITSHKSKLLRMWCLLTGEVIKTVKSLHHLPIGFIEINKVKSSNLLTAASKNSSNKKTVKHNEDRIDTCRSELSWTTVSGAAVKLWEAGGTQMSRLVRIENIASVGYVRWDKSSDINRFYVAERHIYVMGPGVKQFDVMHTLEGHYSQVTGIEFGEDNVMISGGRDKVIIMWDMAKSFAKITTIPFPNPIEGLFLTLPFDLYVAVNPSEIRHFDLQSKRLSKSALINLNEDETITGFYPEICKSNMEIVKGCLVSTHTGCIYEIVKAKGNSKDVSIIRQYVGSLDNILCTVFWMNDKIAVANNTNVIKVYTLKTGSCDFLRGHKDIVLSLSASKEWLVSGAKDNKIIFWKSDSLEPQVVMEGHLASVTSVCFNPVEFVAYSVSEDKFLKAWNKKKCMQSVAAHEKDINSVHCSPNGALLATGSRDKTAKVWDAETLTLVKTFKGHKKGVWDAKFSSWDQLLVTSSADTTIKIWSLIDFECIKTFQGHTSSVLQCQFINLGLQVVSVSSDGSMKTWEIKTSTCLTTEECGNDKIWAMEALADGSVVVTGSADSVLLVWHDITEEKANESVAKKMKLFQDDQLLQNVMIGKKWEEAFQLAVDLDRPHTLLKVIRGVQNMERFETIISRLTEDQRFRLINYVTLWNTNTKTSTEAQILLNMIFKTASDEDLKKLSAIKLLPYTEKHYQRLLKINNQMSLFGYFTKQNMEAS